MMRILTCIYFLFSFFIVAANPIDEATAVTIGRTFVMNSSRLPSSTGKAQLQLVYKPGASGTGAKAISSTVYFYVFNILPRGFVIVSGDDALTPILAYSHESNFDPNRIPENTAKWLEGYKKQIRSAIAKHAKPTNEISNQWQRLKNNKTLSNKSATATNVNPLMQTKWDQSPNYNALCPGASVTGCVATAMAQVMKYWNYPATGTGFHSYNPPNNGYGTLSANFGNTTYAWGAMPNQLNGPNNAVATLMYHAGVSVDMNYSPESSGAYVISSQSPVTNCAEYALKTYFGYRNTMQGLERANYTETQWVNLLEAELDASRPVIYAGFGNGGGHCFVADGYDNNDLFHFNWGWSGAFDGYFQINALDPGGVGTGGGAGGYNSGHQAVIGIQPPAAAPQSYSMQLYNYVTPSATTIGYGQPFTVSTNIENGGNATFNGDFAAAIFDNANNFIDYVEIKTGYTLQGGFHYNNNIVFTNAGLFSLLPASYTVSVYYRPTGGNWTALANSGTYTNTAPLNVVNPNDMEMNSEITTTPANSLVVGDPVTVTTNVVNEGAATFSGRYYVALYNLNGDLAQVIDSVDESDGLPTGYTYLDPFLNFTSAAVDVTPGTYLLAMLHNPVGENAQLTGSTHFQNPVKIIVKAAALVGDAYEANDTDVDAANLAITFNNNAATVKTTGANCHTATDVDYYKIFLPAGSNYSINARLHDSYNSGDGNTYTLDALFTYSIDGINWSGTIDDEMADNIILTGGQTVYFKVAPFFVGTIGSYSLDIQLNKTAYSFAWTGTISTDWDNTNNWSTGKLPGITDEITISAGTPFSPIVENGVTANCKSLRANNGATITVATGGKLNIAGK